MSAVPGPWRVHHRAVTGSTNADALEGASGDVFTADFQTAGRGRLDHRWLSQPGECLMMSAVIGVEGQSPDEIAALPLVVGLAVADMVAGFLPGTGDSVRIKWPNDVLVAERKICGILCERKGDRVIAGIGLNVNQRMFPDEISGRATSLCMELDRKGALRLDEVRDAVLDRLGTALCVWRRDGFAALLPKIARFDFLKGRTVCVRRTDDDAAPASGECGGIQPDGSLLVGGERIFAGEAHVLFRYSP